MKLVTGMVVVAVVASPGRGIGQSSKDGVSPLSLPAVSPPAAPTVRDFWPTLEKQYCAKHGGCTASDSPSTAASILLTQLDDAVNKSVWAKQQHMKVIRLTAKSLNALVSQIAPANDSSAGPQGSPIQPEAVPATRPVAQSGITAGVAGTQTGLRLFATIAVNPAGLITTSAATADPGMQKAGTLASRIADLAVVLPIDATGNHKPTSGGLGSFDYVGVRLRVNALPFFQEDLYDQAKKISETLFHQALGNEGSASDKIGAILSSFDLSGCALEVLSKAEAPQCSNPAPADFAVAVAGAERCVEAIDSAIAEEIAIQCGQSIPQLDRERSTELAVYNALQFRRDQHDADYVGLDVRYDYGDPTFSNDPAARGNYLLAGIGAGHRFLSGGASDAMRRFFGVRGRAGWSYSELTRSQPPTNSFDFAGGVEMGTITDFKVLKVSIGVEGRRATTPAAIIVDTNFVDGKIGVEFPLWDGSQLGVVLSVPLSGNHFTTLGFSGNWNALFGALQPPVESRGP